MEGLPQDSAPQTFVEFTLEPVTEGTRLRLVESGFAQAAVEMARSAHKTNSQGWDAELADLGTYLDAAA
ncbi:SRPBCC domain-containing protein [Streptomyces sp. 8K308]|uniref:SRPBCC domain-containing protein n=1 Tax=Streptomyces sp. 8K308 TaxID=2530388 RepID=UPI00244343F9|nr:SRPBCC domain-containing protein [Streptomyces sp. 8K308]